MHRSESNGPFGDGIHSSGYDGGVELHEQQLSSLTERVCRNCGGPVKGRTHKGNPRQTCGRRECRGATTVNGEKVNGVFEKQQAEKAQQEAMDRPLPTKAERQAKAAQLEPVVVAILEAQAKAGNPHAAAKLLDYTSRLLDAEGTGENVDWLAESPSEATDSR